MLNVDIGYPIIYGEENQLQIQHIEQGEKMKLEEYRKNKDLSYEELAILLGLKRSTTYNICMERTNCVSLHNANIIVTKTAGAVDYPELLWGDC